MRHDLGVLAALGVLTVGLAVGIAPADASTTTVSISVPVSIKQGSRTMLSGTVTVNGRAAASTTVTLVGRASGKPYTTLGTTRTSSSGRYTFSVQPASTRWYKATTGSGASAVRKLTVHPRMYADQIAGTPSSTTQLITVKAAGWGSRNATLELWERRSDGSWRKVRRVAARLGANGLTPGATRRQNTSTTPSGNWPIGFGFGTVSSAGWRIPYRRITSKSWWCEESGNRLYNRWVEQSPLTSCDPTWAEHLASYYPQYRRAVLIAFNWRQGAGRGAGIFLHENGRAYTAGCVSIPAHDMYVVSRWLNAAKKPRIAIATASGALS